MKFILSCGPPPLLHHTMRLRAACATVQAAANAKNNLGLRKAKLYVSECMADGGPVLKRIRPRAKGRCVKRRSRHFLLLSERTLPGSATSACAEFMELLWFRRAARILKPTFHLVVKVAEREA